mmetsp:Transcript_4433/g.10720  ORF Transcript_4433/g.10720 Transcript_4433/m.10720 type:complete len:206 (+) Transcript_4433:70-687(+)
MIVLVFGCHWSSLDVDSFGSYHELKSPNFVLATVFFFFLEGAGIAPRSGRPAREGRAPVELLENAKAPAEVPAATNSPTDRVSSFLLLLLLFVLLLLLLSLLVLFSLLLLPPDLAGPILRYFPTPSVSPLGLLRPVDDAWRLEGSVVVVVVDDVLVARAPPAMRLRFFSAALRASCSSVSRWFSLTRASSQGSSRTSVATMVTTA